MGRGRSARGRRFVAGVVVATAVWVLGVAHRSPAAAAATEAVAVLWNAPAECPTSEALHAEVERNLAGKEVAPVAAVVNVLAPSDGQWRATLVVHAHGKRAQRQLEAESCEALASAAAIAIAGAADGARAESSWNDSGTAVLVGGIFDSGTMPDRPAAGIEAAAEQSWTSPLWRLRLVAGTSFFPPQDMGNPMFAGMPSGSYWMVSFFPRACLTAVLSRFEIGPCLGGELIVMHASDIEARPGALGESTQYWPSAAGSAVTAVTVASRVILFARADAVFPTLRRSFTSTTTAGFYDVYKIPSFALRGAVGIELRLF